MRSRAVNQTEKFFVETCRLYAILDATYLAGRDPGEVAGWMIEGGVDLIQVRAKGVSISQVKDLSRRVLEVTQSAGIPLIVNDHAHIAFEIGAQGVHVGQDDLSVAQARQIAGADKWVGKSTHSFEQALAAQEEGADYIGVGPVFATPTKPDYVPGGLKLVRDVSDHIKIPFFCIGGIKLENATDVMSAGASRFVVVSGILQASDIGDYCRRLRTLLDS
jgi:thiamine-phosphate pyrophosphorylase